MFVESVLPEVRNFSFNLFHRKFFLFLIFCCFLHRTQENVVLETRETLEMKLIVLIALQVQHSVQGLLRPRYVAICLKLLENILDIIVS